MVADGPGTDEVDATGVRGAPGSVPDGPALREGSEVGEVACGLVADSPGTDEVDATGVRGAPGSVPAGPALREGSDVGEVVRGSVADGPGTTRWMPLECVVHQARLLLVLYFVQIQ